VADYLRQFDEACTRPCAPITRRYVQRRALLALADPLLFYSIYGFTGSYIGGGSTTGPVPVFPVGGIRVLPSLGFALAPYGTEWTVRGAIQSDRRAKSRELRVTGITLRVGNTGASTTLGLGVRAADVLRLKGLSVDAEVDLWRQPRALADKTSDPLHTGGGANVTTVLPLPPFLRSEWVTGIHVTGGYKAEGFIPGEQLSGGGFLRAGVQVR
jgi:hypothetical protein